MARALKSLRVYAQPRKKHKQIWLPKFEEVQERIRTGKVLKNSITLQRTRVRIEKPISQNLFGEFSLSFRNKSQSLSSQIFKENYQIFIFIS